MPKPLRVFIVLGLLIAGGFLLKKHVFSKAAPDRIVASGLVEATDARLSFKIAGKLKARLVDEGAEVKAGQVVALLEREDQEAAVKKAQAALALSIAQLTELVNGARPQEIADAKAEAQRNRARIAQARSELARAGADDKRFTGLYRQDVVSASEFDVYRTRRTTAQGVLDEADQAAKSAEERLSLKIEGERAERIVQAQAKVKYDQETLDYELVKLGYTELAAPFDGTVLSKAAEPGEWLNPGSAVLVLGDLHKPWLKCFIPEPEIGRIQLGSKVAVGVDSPVAPAGMWEAVQAFFAGADEGPAPKHSGVVSFIASEAEFTPKSVQTFRERIKLVYRVKIELDNRDRVFKPGMPADAYIPPAAQAPAAASR